MAAKIRKGDKVVVLAGRDKGRTGEVVSVDPRADRALVRGVNLVKRHQRQTRAAGGRHHLQGSCRSIFLISRLPIRRTASRRALASRSMADGRKVRVAKRSGAEIDG